MVEFDFSAYIAARRAGLPVEVPRLMADTERDGRRGWFKWTRINPPETEDDG